MHQDHIHLGAPGKQKREQEQRTFNNEVFLVIRVHLYSQIQEELLEPCSKKEKRAQGSSSYLGPKFSFLYVPPEILGH